MAESRPPRPSLPGGPSPTGTPPSAPSARAVAPYLILLGLFGAFWLWQEYRERNDAPVISYSAFFDLGNSGQLEKVTIEGQSVTGELTTETELDGKKVKSFRTLLPAQEDPALFTMLHAKNVDVDVHEQSLGLQLLMALAPWILLIGFFVWMSRRAQRAMGGGGMGGPFGQMLKGRTRKFNRELDVSVKFTDVAGLQAAKRDLEEIVEYLREPERFRRLGAKAPRGVLLVGPPGTGKTLVARAVAGEAGVPFFSINGSEFIELFVGVGALRVRELFDEARKDEPAIIFIDEIDAVGRARGAGLGGGHDEREQTLNQLLSEMDGFSRTEHLVVMAATNRPDVLDPALLRPGRFDRQVVVDRPEFEARVAILKVHTRGKPLAADVDLDALARVCPGFSGADLANLVNEAALLGTRRGATMITDADFRGAFDKIVLGDPREAKLDPAEKRRVAVHEAGHAVVAHYTPLSSDLERVTIIPRGMALGVTMQTPQIDRHIKTQGELQAELCVLMGGYAAERLVLGDISSGAANDLKRATDTAFQMVASFGMSEALGPLHVEHQSEHPFLGRRIATDSGTSDATIHLVENESRRFLTDAHATATALLRERAEEHRSLVDALLERETLGREELVKLLGPPLGNGNRGAPVVLEKRQA